GSLALPPATSLYWIPPSSLYWHQKSVSNISAVAKNLRIASSPTVSGSSSLEDLVTASATLRPFLSSPPPMVPAATAPAATASPFFINERRLSGSFSMIFRVELLQG